MTTSRIYVVASATEPPVERLVRANYPSTAERHVSASLFTARLASQSDLERLLTAGVRVEHLKTDKGEKGQLSIL